MTPTLLAITAFLSHSPGLLNWGPVGPAYLGNVPQSSIFSPTGLISNCNSSIRGLRCWLSLPHLVSSWLELPVYWVILLFYAHSISSHNWPTEYATSTVFGMACFDHHWAKITAMQFTGHPLPVHQFVTVPWVFNPVPYCQPNSPTQSLSLTGQWNMQLPLSLEWHVWPGRRSIYNTSYSNQLRSWYWQCFEAWKDPWILIPWIK